MALHCGVGMHLLWRPGRGGQFSLSKAAALQRALVHVTQLVVDVLLQKVCTLGFSTCAARTPMCWSLLMEMSMCFTWFLAALADVPSNELPEIAPQGLITL